MGNEVTQKVEKPKTEKNVADAVLSKINSLSETGGLLLPKDYSAENALKGAWFVLQETKNKDGKSALEVCSRESQISALYEMVVQGLNPVKKQCYFIVYGTTLQMQRSYMGSIALAKRFGSVADVRAGVIYDGDEFEYEIEEGNTRITKHKQSLDSLGGTVKGAYCILTKLDGTKYTEVMSIKQIQSAWGQGATKGNSPAHKNFSDEMAKKTVISRACKLLINTSSDSVLLDDEDDFNDKPLVEARNGINTNANKGEVIDIDCGVSVETGQSKASDAPPQTTTPPAATPTAPTTDDEEDDF